MCQYEQSMYLCPLARDATETQQRRDKIREVVYWPKCLRPTQKSLKFWNQICLHSNPSFIISAMIFHAFFPWCWSLCPSLSYRIGSYKKEFKRTISTNCSISSYDSVMIFPTTEKKHINGNNRILFAVTSFSCDLCRIVAEQSLHWAIIFGRLASRASRQYTLLSKIERFGKCRSKCCVAVAPYMSLATDSDRLRQCRWALTDPKRIKQTKYRVVLRRPRVVSHGSSRLTISSAPLVRYQTTRQNKSALVIKPVPTGLVCPFCTLRPLSHTVSPPPSNWFMAHIRRRYSPLRISDTNNNNNNTFIQPI